MENHLDRVDPDIRRFLEEITRAYADHPPFESLNIDEKRRVAASVRAPWSCGGPSMARTQEFLVPVGASSVRVRLHYPKLAGNAAALVYAHGGGWMIFDLDTHDRLMREYALRAGIVVIGVDYTRAPEARFPVALDEIVAVVHWLRAQAPGFAIDPDRIALGGDSAGANLAVGACLRLRDAGAPNAVRAMVLNYGAFDAITTTSSHQRFGAGELMLSSQEMAGFWAQYLSTPADAANPYACPLHADPGALPPAFMAVAELDVLYDENLAMAQRLRAAGVPVSCTVYSGTVHGFIEAMSIAQVSRRAIEDTAYWLRAILQ